MWTVRQSLLFITCKHKDRASEEVGPISNQMTSMENLGHSVNGPEHICGVDIHRHSGNGSFLIHKIKSTLNDHQPPTGGNAMDLKECDCQYFRWNSRISVKYYKHNFSRATKSLINNASRM